jgi:hypothetical protein
MERLFFPVVGRMPVQPQVLPAAAGMQDARVVGRNAAVIVLIL